MVSRKRSREYDGSLDMVNELRARVQCLSETRDGISQIIVQLETQIRQIEGTEESVGSSDTAILSHKERKLYLL